MHANVGDRIVIHGNKAGQPDRHCTVLEVRHENGEPPFFVRWDDNDREDLYFPGSDATVVSNENK